MLPNFFIVGAPKAGTTSLYHYLSQHSEVFLSPKKELNYFSQADIVAQCLYYHERGVGDRAEFESFFENANGAKAVGEASVSYLFYQNVASRIHALLPEAKIIIVLRNPIDRAFSHYLMDRRLGYVEISFDDIVYQRSGHPLGDLYYQQAVSLGMYYEQVKRYLDLFGEKRVKIFLNDDLLADTPGVVRSLFAFLGVDTSFETPLTRHHNVYGKPRNGLVRYLYTMKGLRIVTKKLFPAGFAAGMKKKLLIPGEKPVMNRQTGDYLLSIYKEDIGKLAALIKRDLSHWLG